MDRNYFKKYSKTYYHMLRAQYIEILGGKCVKCGTTDNLQFDHIDPTTKNFNIGHLLNYSQEEVLEEIKKCQLLCWTDHIQKTRLQQFGKEPWNKGKWKHGTLTSYQAKACRCDECREFAYQYRKSRKVARLAG